MINSINKLKDNKVAFHFPHEKSDYKPEWFLVDVGHNNRDFWYDDEMSPKDLVDKGYSVMIVEIMDGIDNVFYKVTRYLSPEEIEEN